MEESNDDDVPMLVLADSSSSIAHAPVDQGSVPVTILTGYLGSGTPSYLQVTSRYNYSVSTQQGKQLC